MIEIDQDYETQVGRLDYIKGNVNDYPAPPAHPVPVTTARPTALANWTPGNEQPAVTQQEISIIGQTQQAVGQMMQHVPQRLPDTTHTRQVDSAVTVARASIIAALPVLAVHGVVTGAMIGLAWAVVGSGGGLWLLGWLIVWGVASYIALERSRERGLYHSSSGVAHHALDNDALEIRERYATARYATDRAFEFVENQRRLTHERANNQ